MNPLKLVHRLVVCAVILAACVDPALLETEVVPPPVFELQIPEREDAVAAAEPRPTATPFATPTPTPGAPTPTATPKSTRSRILLGLLPVGRVRPTATPVPQPTPDGEYRRASVPMLMYHYIEEPPPNADSIRFGLSVPPNLFATHLDVIQELGFETISVRDVINHLALGTPLPSKPIVLTFDDGYANHFTNALPLLTERGMVGTFFVISEFPHSGNPSYMTWDQIRQMVRAGMEIESHARLHESLAGRSETYLRDQARGGILTFEQELGYTPRVIAYPMGFYDQRVIDVFRDEGYWAGLTTQNGLFQDNRDPFRMWRIRMHPNMAARELEWLLTEEGQAWLAGQQTVSGGR